MTEPYYQDGLTTIYHGDCREIMSALPERCDILLTDPPYASAAATATTGWGRQKWGGNWGDMSLVGLMAEHTLDSAPLSTNGHEVLWFCDHLSYAILIPILFRRYPMVQSIVWDRDMLGMGAYFRKQTEFIAYARGRTSADFDSKTARDLIRLRPDYAQRQHPSQKPVALIEELLRPTAGQRVLDPYMGSGTSLVAARNLGRRAIGVEIEERYCEIAARRLSQGVLPLAPAGRLPAASPQPAPAGAETTQETEET